MEWYYVGQFGTLGPLTLDQMRELVREGVLMPDSMVWHVGLQEWTRASKASELAPLFPAAQVKPPAHGPPPIPEHQTYQPPPIPSAPTVVVVPYLQPRSRILAGVLNLVIPGVGRMYMGFWGTGLLQLFLSPCFLGWLWSVIDGVMILTGQVAHDRRGVRMDP